MGLAGVEAGELFDQLPELWLLEAWPPPVAPNIEPKLAQKFLPAPPTSGLPLKKKESFFFFFLFLLPLKMKTSYYKTFEGHMVGGISDDRDNFSVCLALALQSPCVVVTLSIIYTRIFFS